MNHLPPQRSPSRLLGVGTLVILLLGCSSSLPGPPAAPSSGRKPQRTYVEVPYPPPPAKVEAIPVGPGGRSVWVDGQWAWEGRWVWRRGGWVLPRLKTYFVPWTVVRKPDGTLLFAEPSWHEEATGARILAPRNTSTALYSTEDDPKRPDASTSAR